MRKSEIAHWICCSESALVAFENYAIERFRAATLCMWTGGRISPPHPDPRVPESSIALFNNPILPKCFHKEGILLCRRRFIRYKIFVMSKRLKRYSQRLQTIARTTVRDGEPFLFQISREVERLILQITRRYRSQSSQTPTVSQTCSLQDLLRVC